MTRRNPGDRWQQRVAWHELGHALVDRRLGIRVVDVVHTIGSGFTRVDVTDRQWREFAIGCMAGSEAERLWEKYHNGWWGSKGHCQGDLQLFHHAVQRSGRRLSESTARAEARKILRRQRDRLETLAPRLITTGRLTGRQL